MDARDRQASIESCSQCPPALRLLLAPAGVQPMRLDSYRRRTVRPLRLHPSAPPRCRHIPRRRPCPVDRSSRTVQESSDPHLRMRWHGQLTAIQQQRNRSPGWIYHSYIAKFREPPPVQRFQPIPPTPEVLAWVRSRDIAYAKAMAAKASAAAAAAA